MTQIRTTQFAVANDLHRLVVFDCVAETETSRRPVQQQMAGRNKEDGETENTLPGLRTTKSRSQCLRNGRRRLGYDSHHGKELSEAGRAEPYEQRKASHVTLTGTGASSADEKMRREHHIRWEQKVLFKRSTAQII